MCPMPDTRPLLVAAMLTSACPATIGGTMADGGPDAGLRPPVDSAPALDVPTGPCRWRVGAAVVLPAITSSAPHRTILDARPAEGGAWVLTSDDAGGDRQPDVALERVDASGNRRADGAVRFPTGYSPLSASLAVDESLGRRAVLEEVRELRGASCGLTVLDARGNPSPARTIAFPTGGFSLSGCRDLLVNGAGYTFLAEQIRALWGVSVVQLDAEGQTPAQLAPSVLDGFPEVLFARVGLPDRSFVLISRETLEPMPRRTRLHLRRYDERGMALGDVQTPLETLRAVRAFTVTGGVDALVALWEEADASTAPYQVVVRALGADGSPRGEARPLASGAFYQGGLAATLASGDVLAAGIFGSGLLRPVVTPLSLDGSPRGDALPIPIPPGATRVERVRLVATPSGALVLYTTDPGSYPNRLVAVPLTCER